jgi:signal peptidase I
MSEAKAKPAKGEGWENTKTLLFALLLFLVVRIIIFQPFTIPSQSMEPGLRPGDYIIVTKWDYGWSRHSIPFSPPLFGGRILASEPRRGDVIVFKAPMDGNKDYIKRLIGLPGDRVQVKDGQVILNGQPIPQQDLGVAGDAWGGLAGRREGETLPGGKSYVVFDQGYQMADDTEVFVVPEDQYFFMGDNRDNSLDSRFPTARGGVGFVRKEHLIGKARFILFSWDGASIFKPWTWFTRAVPGRFFKGIV